MSLVNPVELEPRDVTTNQHLARGYTFPPPLHPTIPPLPPSPSYAANGKTMPQGREQKQTLEKEKGTRIVTGIVFHLQEKGTSKI